MRDQLFTDNKKGQTPFTFDAEVASVFDDMIARSVPGYETLQACILRLVEQSPSPRRLYDLGCSTGTTCQRLFPVLTPQDCYIGIDYSSDMLALAAQKNPSSSQINWIQHDLNTPFDFQLCSTVIANLCLQFLEPKHRLSLITALYNALQPKGTLILVEKIEEEDSSLQSLFETLYHGFKSDQGYSTSEIRNKQAALANVLRPDTHATHLDRLAKAGFHHAGLFYKWGPFCLYVAIKEEI
ncbi:MAG: methyltransferase domain-containing protein [Candidatus Margulisiibacteriota bacterium]